MLLANERGGDGQEALKAAMEGHTAMMQTACPGLILSFDPAACTATVQPAITSTVRAHDGTASFPPLPPLADVPVFFPAGGGYTLTFPVAAGDECLLVFAARCIDGWFEKGGVQQPLDPRTHSLSDAFAYVGVRSKARPLSGISTANTQLRTDDGTSLVELAPAGLVRIIAPGGLHIVGAITQEGGGSCAFTGPISTINTITSTSTIAASGEITSGSIGLQGHHHDDAQGGSTSVSRT